MSAEALGRVYSNAELAEMVRGARQRVLDLVVDLTDDQMMGPKLEIVNPVLWEIGHAAWFQERWVLVHCGGAQPIHAHAESLWDSIEIEHDARWDLPLPGRDETLRYIQEVRDRVLERLACGQPSPEETYFILLSVFHEDMHTEAFTYSRQTLGYPAPTFTAAEPDEAREMIHLARRAGPCPGDVEVPGGTYLLGASRDAAFVFDNEKWEHPVDIAPFRIARAAVTQEEFRAFVEDDGYVRRELWSDEGWKWRVREEAIHPVYWRREGSQWLRRDFDEWKVLEPHRAMTHVSWHEAKAYCRWANRRLPSEAEWEAVATGWTVESGGKRRYPWGEDTTSLERANLDWLAMGCVDVGAFGAGDSEHGCRQMLGNVWEWCDDTFQPFPGFVPDPYKEYSTPMFGVSKVLRGGCWTTRSRMLRNTWRNYYPPERRDVWCGFRTCALEEAS